MLYIGGIVNTQKINPSPMGLRQALSIAEALISRQLENEQKRGDGLSYHEFKSALITIRELNLKVSKTCSFLNIKHAKIKVDYPKLAQELGYSEQHTRRILKANPDKSGRVAKPINRQDRLFSC